MLGNWLWRHNARKTHDVINQLIVIVLYGSDGSMFDRDHLPIKSQLSARWLLQRFWTFWCLPKRGIMTFSTSVFVTLHAPSVFFVMDICAWITAGLRSVHRTMLCGRSPAYDEVSASRFKVGCSAYSCYYIYRPGYSIWYELRPTFMLDQGKKLPFQFKALGFYILWF